MLQCKFTPFPLLETDRLTLRQLAGHDANELFHLRSDDEVMKYIARPKAKSVLETTVFIQTINDSIRNNENINWAITLNSHNRLIGNISFWRIIKEHHRAEMGYVLHPYYHGQGLMQEAIAAVLKYGFENMRLHSVEANVDPRNLPSIKLLEKCGFIQEGYFKEKYFWDGHYLDSISYTKLSGW